MEDTINEPAKELDIKFTKISYVDDTRSAFVFYAIAKTKDGQQVKVPCCFAATDLLNNTAEGVVQLLTIMIENGKQSITDEVARREEG